MTDSSSMPPAELFHHQWNDIMNRWMSAEPGDPEYPALTGRQRSLLKELQPEELAGRYMILVANNRFVREEVESHLRPKIQMIFSRELEMDIQLVVNVVDTKQSTGADTTADASADTGTNNQDSDTTPSNITQSTGATSSRDDLAAEHARGYAASTDAVDNEPSPHPEGWGGMSNPSLGHTERTSGDTAGGEELASDKTKKDGEQDGGSAQGDNERDVRPAPAVNSGNGANGNGNGNGNGGEEPHINPAYTFENFVTGNSNQLAYAACRAVSEYPGASYNPLLIWGESGLGKTHLLHAIGHYARELQPNMRIKYVSSEELTNDFINSISAGMRDDFKRRYRNLDLLIVDDTQFLQGKESTQEEFFHTFNALHQAGKQIVLSSDRPPRQLTTLEDRLRTRFESGLITDVQSPDLETRMAILSRKAESRNVELPQDVKELIASRYEKSIRELEGALTRVIAYCSLGHQPLTLQSATAALRDIMPDDADTEITPQLVIDVVAEFYNITSAEILGKGRARTIANARQIGMYLCRELTDLSLPKVGLAFGGRDHTTVMYAERRINDKIQEDHKTFNEVQELTQRIKARARN